MHKRKRIPNQTDICKITTLDWFSFFGPKKNNTTQDQINYLYTSCFFADFELALLLEKLPEY